MNQSAGSKRMEGLFQRKPSRISIEVSGRPGPRSRGVDTFEGFDSEVWMEHEAQWRYVGDQICDGRFSEESGMTGTGHGTGKEPCALHWIKVREGPQKGRIGFSVSLLFYFSISRRLSLPLFFFFFSSLLPPLPHTPPLSQPL